MVSSLSTNAIVDRKGNASVLCKRLVVLGDLITSWLVMVEVVFPIKSAGVLDGAVQGNCST